MHIPHYPIRPAESGFRYGFVSRGSKGDIEKVVVFREMDEPGIYNLGFGDKAIGEARVDDLARTDNGDTQKVLATVAAIASDFMRWHPGSIVFATGSTASRTRLYQRAIGANIHWLEESFHLFGYREGSWEAFTKGAEYEAFYVVEAA